MKKRISLEEAIKFHGHLGPYLVLGLLAGELALKKLRYKKYFGLDVKIWGANKRPKSCLIDGLQLSTGATYGKGNIRKLNSKIIKIVARGKRENNRLVIKFREELIKELKAAKTHRDSEILANKLYKTNPSELFLTES